MAFRYTDVNTRVVYSTTKGATEQAGKLAKFWTNADGTGPVDIGLYSEDTPETPGASTGTNVLEVQDDSMWPQMWDLDGVKDHVWIQIGTPTSPGNLYKIYCDADQRTDALETRVSELFPVRSAGAQLPVAVGVTVTDEGTSPRPTEYFDGYLWATTSNGAIHRSSDNGQTWTQVATPPTRFLAFGIASDGEVVGCHPEFIYRSSGWATNPATATWSQRTTVSPGVARFQEFSFDGSGDKWIVSEYSSTRADSKWVQISTDGGRTWTTRWDTSLQYPASHQNSHLHAVCYDRWADRFWFTEGHDEPCGAYYSDDDGATWTRLTGGVADTLEPMPTVMVATDDGICCGTDSVTYGAFGIRRTDDPADMVMHPTWRWQTVKDGVLGFSERGWRDPRDGLVYIGYIVSTDGIKPVVTAGTAAAANLVWTAPDGDNGSRVWGVWVTDDDTFVAHTATAGNATHRQAYGRVRRPGYPVVSMADAGNALTGDAQGINTSLAAGPSATTNGWPDSVAVGKSSSAGSAADGKSVAVGAGAAAFDRGVAVGAAATLLAVDAVAVGSSATAGAKGVAVGQSAAASGSGGVAFGRQAVASGVDSTALGQSADATNTNAVCIGSNAAVTGVSSVGIGQGVSCPNNNAVVIGNLAATTQNDAVVIGRNGSSTGGEGVAVGETAVVNATQGIAIGANATVAATHNRSVTLGFSTTTTAADQVQLGAKHIEMTELAADPAAPATNGARLYFKDNGAGKTQLCVRFPTGAVQVIATEP